MPDSFYARYGKRIFDCLVSFWGLSFLSPLFVVIAVLIKFQDGGPVFFRQKRVGRGFKSFRIFKFRTMKVGAERIGPQITQAGDPRITPLGRFLRKTKMDELPQLVNVLQGEMSLVGPRPEVEKYVQYFKKDYEEILTVRPGITDYAALEFRNEEEILKNYPDPEKSYVEDILPQKIILYKKYLRNISFVTDLKLIFRTFRQILK